MKPFEDIEDDFVDWNRAAEIAKQYGINGRSALYRHGRATGLDVRRRENLRMVVEKVLEDVDYVDTPTASALLRAVRTLACINERGQWVEPPTAHTVVSVTEAPARSFAPATTTAPRRAPRRSPMQMIPNARRSTGIAPRPQKSNLSSSKSLELATNHSPLATDVPNRHTYEKLEMDANHSKQTSEVISNRHT
jgi:hypothetical protein